MRRIERLLTAMTLEEKLGQLNMIPGSRTVTGPGGHVTWKRESAPDESAAC